MKRLSLLLALLLCFVAEPTWADYLGDFPTSATVYWKFTTNDGSGGRVDPSSAWEAADLRCYKNGSTTERSSTVGYTITSTFDTMTGVTHVAIDTSDNTDAGFWAAGNEYQCVLYPDETVSSQSVAAVSAMFSIERSGGVLALIKARTPNAAAGAAGGLFIAGTNAPVTITGSGAALTLTSTGGNGAGLAITGNGSGNGVTVAAGATGKGIAVSTTAGDGVSVTPTAGHALVLTANGTSKHGMTVTGGTAGTSHGALFTAGTGGDDLVAASGITVDACTGCSSVQGPTIMPEVAYVKDSTSVIVEIFIKDSSTGSGKTGLTSGSAGLTAGWGRADQGNAANTTCVVAAATRGTYLSCGFVEKDATNAAGIYEVGLPAAVLADGADQAVFTIYGVSGTTPTILPIALVDFGLASIDSKLGTPAGADMSADIASVKGDTTSIKGKTDSMGFTGANINANTQATAAALTYNLTGDVTGNLSGSVGSVTGAVGSVTGAVGSVTGAVGSVTGNVGGNVTGSVGSVAAGGIVASSFGAGAIDATAIAADAIGASEIAAAGADKIGDDVQTRFPANFASQAITAGGVVTAGGTFRKNVASQVFPIYMVNAAGAAVTGSTVSVTVSKDGAAFGAITGSVVETGSGWYDVQLSQADTNCDNCKYVATGTGGATARPFYFRTAP